MKKQKKDLDAIYIPEDRAQNQMIIVTLTSELVFKI